MTAIKPLAYQTPFVVAASASAPADSTEEAPAVSVTQPSENSAIRAAHCRIESIGAQAPAPSDKAIDHERIIANRRRSLDDLVSDVTEQGREFDATVARGAMDETEESDATKFGITLGEFNAYFRRALTPHTEADMRRDFYTDESDEDWAKRLESLTDSERAKLKAGRMTYAELENANGSETDGLWVRDYDATYRPFMPSCAASADQAARPFADYASAFTDATRDTDITAIKGIMGSNELARAQTGISPANFEKLVRAAGKPATAEDLHDALGDAGEMTPAEKTRLDKGQMSYAEYAFIASREATTTRYPGARPTPKLKPVDVE